LKFLRRDPKSRLIHAIGRRKSQKALLEHRIRKEGRFWDSESQRDEQRENPKEFRIVNPEGVNYEKNPEGVLRIRVLHSNRIKIRN
jgi:hypothetical protein